MGSSAIREFLAQNNITDSQSLNGSRSISITSAISQTVHVQLEEIKQRNIELVFQLTVLQDKYEKLEKNESKDNQVDDVIQGPLLFGNRIDNDTPTQLEHLELVHHLEVIREELNLMVTASASDLPKSGTQRVLGLRNYTDNVLVELKREDPTKQPTEVFQKLQTVRNGLKELVVEAEYLSEVIVRKLARVQRELTLAQKRWLVSTSKNEDLLQLERPQALTVSDSKVSSKTIEACSEILVAGQPDNQEVFERNKNKLEARIAELEKRLDELQGQFRCYPPGQDTEESYSHRPPAKSRLSHYCC